MVARTSLALLFLAGSSLLAQDFISARAGYVNFQEDRLATRRQLQDGESFSTRRGRAELLLTAGSFMRLDQNSEVRMLSTRLTDVRMELVQGTVSVEVNEMPKETRLMLVWEGRSFPIERRGLYRFQVREETLRVAVQDGKLRLPESNVTLKSGRWVEVSSSGISAPAKFDRHAQDSFDLWSKGRASLLATASYRSAHSLSGSTFRNSLWAFNPFFGFYTYLPYSAYIMSPWGFPFYSPRYVWIYYPSSGRGGWRGGGGGGGGSAVPGGGSSGGSASSPAPPAPRNPPASRGGSHEPRTPHNPRIIP